MLKMEWERSTMQKRVTLLTGQIGIGIRRIKYREVRKWGF